MKAKTASLISKGIAVAMCVTAFVAHVFFKVTINVMDVVALASAIALIFGDVSLNTALDKFRGKKDVEPDPKTPEAKGLVQCGD